ncbi:MAG: hypothetical protein AAFQ94_27825 [Bacteroidota bacterium]
MKNTLSNYSFEGESSNRLDISALSSNRKTFLKNLGATEKEIAQLPEEETINEFLIQYCSNIDWYQKRQTRENNYRKLYNILSIALMILIPVGIFIVSLLFSKSNVELVSSSVATILTSVLAIHKTFSSWIEKRKLNTLFHAAASKLKTRLYELEEEWNSRLAFVDLDGQIQYSPDFLKGLREGIKYSRAVLDEEKQAYYELIAFPKIELSSILSSGKSDSQTHFTNFQSSSFKQAAEMARLTSQKKMETEE